MSVYTNPPLEVEHICTLQSLHETTEHFIKMINTELQTHFALMCLSDRDKSWLYFLHASSDTWKFKWLSTFWDLSVRVHSPKTSTAVVQYYQSAWPGTSQSIDVALSVNGIDTYKMINIVLWSVFFARTAILWFIDKVPVYAKYLNWVMRIRAFWCY